MCKYSDIQLNNRALKLKKLKAEKAELEKKIKELQADIIAGFEIDGPFKENTDKYRFTYYAVSNPGIDTKRLKEDMPDVYRAYYKESAYMQLRVTDIA